METVTANGVGSMALPVASLGVTRLVTTSRVPTITASREPAVVRMRSGLTGSLILIWPRAWALRNSASERVSTSPSSRGLGRWRRFAACGRRRRACRGFALPWRSRFTRTRKSDALALRVLGFHQFRSFPTGDGGIVGGVAGDHLERALRIIGDDAALVPCLAELRIGEGLGGFVHRRPEKGQPENDRRHAEQGQHPPVEAIGIAGWPVRIVWRRSGVR